MNKFNYHNIDLSDKTFLITGGAGFIGSSIVDYLLNFNPQLVRVVDNLSNGDYENIKKYEKLKNFEFIEGDIRNYELCLKSVKGINYISHQAALGSVPRSITDPLTSNEVNVTGFLNILNASKNSKDLLRFVYAASSSTYGDSTLIPKKEGNEGRPISPYAVTKLVNELYADVYSKVFDFHSIGLRYFNVFGPKQNPNNPYAAVIPLFCKSFLFDQEIKIFGDGETSRDFTYIENVVQANIKALLFNQLISHEVFNVACGEETSLNQVVDFLSEFSGKCNKPIYYSERKGDIKHSKADITKVVSILEYNNLIFFKEGLQKTYNWYIENKNRIF